MLESTFQRKLRERLEKMFPGCYILKNDAELLSGVPDLLILYGNRWAMLEVKKTARDAVDANMDQQFHVRQLNMMYFAAFIYPENEEDVLRELQQALAPRREARVSQRE